MIKLITIDLDNTLFDKNKCVSDYNKEMIKRALSDNIHVVIATGRPLTGIKSLLKSLNMTSKNDYAICYNGGKIYKLSDYSEIEASYITGKMVKEIYKLSQDLGMFFHAFRDDGILICPKYNKYTEIEKTLNNLDMIIQDINQIKDDEKYIKAMIVDSKENIDFAYNNVPSHIYKEYNVVRSSNIFLEFLNKDCDKGKALIKLRDYLHLQHEETMAIGDASNDIGMIKEAYVGVAMENAFPEVKEIADFITKDHENSGVGYAIDKIVYKK